MAASQALESLEKYCDEKFEDDAPPFGKLKTALTEVRHTIHALLNKKREKEPDPVEEVPVVEAAAAVRSDGEGGDGRAGFGCSLRQHVCGGARGSSARQWPALPPARPSCASGSRSARRLT